MNHSREVRFFEMVNLSSRRGYCQRYLKKFALSVKKTLNPETVEELKRQYIETGLEFTHAHEKAWLEHRLEVGIDHRGMQLEFVLYGEFYKPDEAVEYPSLGVTISTSDASEELNTNAVSALKGSVRLFEPGLAGIRNAFERLSVLTGCMTILQCGVCGIGWTSHYMLHGPTVQLAKESHDNNLSKVVLCGPRRSSIVRGCRTHELSNGFAISISPLSLILMSEDGEDGRPRKHGRWDAEASHPCPPPREFRI